MAVVSVLGRGSTREQVREESPTLCSSMFYTPGRREL